MKVLVVDDSSMFRKAVIAELDAQGYEFIEAEDGASAIEKVQAGGVDLITLDVEMPKMNGFETCKAIRAFDTEMPIIFLTGNDDLNGRKEGFDSGANEFLTKSFHPGELKITVDRILHPRERRGELNVLVVEDVRLSRAMIKSILEQEGVNVFEAENGKVAYEILKKEGSNIHCVVTDYNMPVMSGSDLCEKIRLEMGLKTLPVIFLSAESDQFKVLEFYKVGATDFIVKPFFKELFISRIMAHLEVNILYRNLEKNIKKLEESNKVKDQFLAVCSHDLRGPIGNIMGFAGVMREDENLDKEHLEALDYIDSSANYLNNLIEDLLDISKMQVQEELELEKLDILEILNNCKNSNQTLSEGKKIDIILNNKTKHTQIYVKGHRTSFIRISNNLISNAIKFSNSGSSIQMIVSTDDASIVTIQFKDAGLGIPQSALPTIFEKFSGAGRAGTAGEKSTGLGLSIVQDLVIAQGGEISVESEENVGSTFTIKIPLIPGS
jgi:two-component system, sensor histidine kinase and response regulator